MLRGALALTLALVLSPALAQNYPTHPVKVVVPYAVGGSADVYGRVLAAKLSEAMGQPFVIENRPGGGAVIGTDAVAKSAPDGYTVLVMSDEFGKLLRQDIAKWSKLVKETGMKVD